MSDMNHLRRLSLGLFLALLPAGSAVCRAQPEPERPAPTVRLPTNRPPAPAFPDRFQWLNTEAPLTLAEDLKGHVVLLDFWTYCCINCMHVLPDLEHLEEKYADVPFAVVGVHSAKFTTEEDPANIRQAIQRYRIRHPVIVDENHAIWDRYGVRAWPTMAVVDSEGKIVGTVSGEGNRQLLEVVIEMLLAEGRQKKTLAEKPFKTKPENLIPSLDGLAFPGKIIADESGDRLLIADSNHDRILMTDPDGKVLSVIGAGTRGFKDGPAAEALFYNPQGMALVGQILYVADTDNHALRAVDLATGAVTTIAGDGKQAFDRTGGGVGVAQGLSSPWDVAEANGKLYIAMAGTHQIWIHDLAKGTTSAWTGNGREHITDGLPDEAALAQPSGLALLDGWLYFADSEGSSLRRANLKDGLVQTLVGAEGEPGALFKFGYRDGPLAQSLFQHCLGVAVLGKNIVVADTYNNALRLMDLDAKTTQTLLGGPDKKDLDEPSGVAVLKGVIYVADTNHHRIVRFDPATGQAMPLDIRLNPKPSPP